MPALTRRVYPIAQMTAAGSAIFEGAMKFIHLFLVGYFVLVVGIVMALWQTGILKNVSPIWMAIGVTMAVGVGIMASVSSGKPATTKEG